MLCGQDARKMKRIADIEEYHIVRSIVHIALWNALDILGN